MHCARPGLRVWYWPSPQLCCGRSRMWAALYQSIMWAAVEFRLNQAGLANKQPSLLGSAAETEQPHARLISDSFIIISAACASQRKGGKERCILKQQMKSPGMKKGSDPDTHRAHVRIQVEKTLYHSPESHRLFLAVRVCILAQALNEELQHLLPQRPIT